ncbi:MAG TPA: hypothetical protein VFR87_20650 [Nocardioidaceae bacterium]|nr:hypothetical protein [Nocardioidaceae bacterium]
MADRVFLHIGAPKTGTTYLQAVLFSNRRTLRQQGIQVPGKNRYSHGAAALGVRAGKDAQQFRSWRRMARHVRRFGGHTSVISNEWFARANREQVADALAELDGVETHIVYTARDLLEQVPAAWQEALKSAITPSLNEFVASLDAPTGRWRWGVLDPFAALRRWGADLPPEQVHLITLPPKGNGPSPLWSRFAEVTGIDPGSCRTDVAQARESLGVEAARLLQLMGPGLREHVAPEDGKEWAGYNRWVERYLAHELLVPLGGKRIALDRRTARTIRRRSKESVHRLQQAGYDVVGDLSELTAAKVPRDALRPEDVPDADIVKLATTVIPQLLRRVQQEVARADEASQDLG